MQHGLFHCSGVFVSNERESIAFYLAEKGFDVWLGNNRGVLTKHAVWTEKDMKFWDWSIDELAKYDFPCLVQSVLDKTGYEKLTYIGHSQGSAQAFAGLAISPVLQSKLKLFIAFGPALYLRPLDKFPLIHLTHLESSTFYTLFGVGEYFPFMRSITHHCPLWLTTFMSYLMFSYLFGWTDTNWAKERKKKYFLFSPKASSSKQLYHWKRVTLMGQLAPYETVMKYENMIKNSSSVNIEEVLKNNPYDVSNIHIPMAIFHGGNDNLVNWPKLEKNLSVHPNCVLLENIEGYEHVDMMWSHDAPVKVYEKIIALSQNL